ncbi:sulfurtransferase TusA family protein [Thiomicrorhabdus sp. ZW0627]|uniref:sulfurtransferase TusA family protein n=1 Tax=Thiomicrorhabdus sp. ZW0627 TaxID=3039774 RepID=UPI002436E608|nr:sulfurtransferase TusA family protein [Thiomicrorhabdus sp. ZW0627]MDG6774808.1 sulfurtransferase TusA family protein [Thiomicrorhabdus sp. ZW0627]
MNPETDQNSQVYQVDAKGLKCPMPVIKLQQQVRKSQPDDRIEIECTDPGAEKDISSWAKVNKHEILQCETTDFGLKITLRVVGRNRV